MLCEPRTNGAPIVPIEIAPPHVPIVTATHHHDITTSAAHPPMEAEVSLNTWGRNRERALPHPTRSMSSALSLRVCALDRRLHNARLSS